GGGIGIGESGVEVCRIAQAFLEQRFLLGLQPGALGDGQFLSRERTDAKEAGYHQRERQPVPDSAHVREEAPHPRSPSAVAQPDTAERESALMAALPRTIAAAKEHAPAYRERLAKVRPADIIDRRALVDLPLTHKSDLIELQRQTPPFGGFAAVPVAAVARV